MKVILERNHQRFALLAGQLNSLSPLQVLSRGYSIVTDRESGQVVYSTEQVERGDPLNIRLSDGEVSATVTEIKNI